jgi:hypothetical protein
MGKFSFGHCAWRRGLATARGRCVYFATARGRCILPLRVAAARNRSDWFPAPSSGQALRPAPVMNLGGLPRLVDHASAASDR